ncbi:MAG: hypothetical protein IT379_09050 [Deltaproteobacteria bacterium]|nr:hypothetical protein [Deltaproteobacteria bacterium]
MADVHVWEEEEVDCRAKFFGGVLTQVKACKFNFYEGTKKVGSVAGKLEGGTRKTATAKYAVRKCKDDEATYTLGYKLEVDGKEKSGFVQQVVVWARTVFVEAKDKSNAAVADCPFSVRQRNPRPKGEERLESLIELKTDDQGKIEHRLAFAAPFYPKVLSPYYLVDGKVVIEPRKKTYTVAKGFKATLLFPVEGDEHIQWVNLPKDPAHPSHGHKIKVVAAAEDPTQAAEDDTVFWKVTFTPIGCGREAPALRGVWLHGSGNSYTGKTTLDGSKQSTLEIDLDHAGGDKCVVSVGGTPEANDAEVTIVNWRKLFYEMATIPDMQLEDVTLDDGTASKGFPATLTDWFTERLDKAFVKFVQVGLVRFDESNGTMAPAIYPSEYVDRPAGKKALILADWGPDFSGFATNDKRTVKMSVCDYVMMKAGTYRMKPELDAATLEYDVFAELGERTFEKSMDYASDGGGVRCSISNAAWVALPDAKAHPNHPALKGTPKVAKKGTITVSAATFEWLSWGKIKIKLPPAAQALVGPSSATKCPIRVSFEIETARGFNGSAGGGEQTLVFSRPPEAVAATTCHELGHSMGQTVYPSGGRKQKPPKGMAYPKTIPKGDKYDDSWGHTGSHCAHGLSTKDKKKSSPSAFQGSCLMFGAGGNEVPPARDAFCPECLKYVQGRRLDDVVTSFGSRSDGDL